MKRILSAVSLFSGAVDGLGIAAQMAGFAVTHHYEIDEWCCKVLHKNFPHSIIVQDDIHNVDALPTVDLVLGSPPCQSFSLAGKRGGFHDERYLWPEMYRLVRASRPRSVLFENVEGGVSAGLLDVVCGDLESAGYDTFPLVYPACLFGAPHERYRMFVIGLLADTVIQQHTGTRPVADTYNYQEWNSAPFEQSRRTISDVFVAGRETVGNAAGTRPYQPQQAERWSHSAKTRTGSDNGPQRSSAVRQFLRRSQPRMVRTHDGFADGLDGFNFPGFPAYMGWPQYAYEPSRTVEAKESHHAARIAALGNAVVWQQVYPLLRTIAERLLG